MDRIAVRLENNEKIRNLPIVDKETIRHWFSNEKNHIFRTMPKVPFLRPSVKGASYA